MTYTEAVSILEQADRDWEFAVGWGLNLQYVVQPSPDGLAQAFILAEEFLAGSPACLILGDNIFYAEGLSEDFTAGADYTSGDPIAVAGRAGIVAADVLP